MFHFYSFFSLTGHKGNGSWIVPTLFSWPAMEKTQLEKSQITHTFPRSKLFIQVSETSQWGVDIHFTSQPQEPSIKEEAQGWVAGPIPRGTIAQMQLVDRSSCFLKPRLKSSAGSFPSPKINILAIHSAPVT